MHRPILVTGAHRSGTTWVGRMLSAGPGITYISEPLNVHHRPGILDAPVNHWYQYICKDNESQFLAAFQGLIQFHYDPAKELTSLRSLKDAARMVRDWSEFSRGRAQKNRPLIKDPFAVFSTPWFADKLSCQVVITVRHPAAFVSSLKRLDWPFDLKNLSAQPLLMRDWLHPYRGEMEALGQSGSDILSSAALLWRMIYASVEALRQDHPQVIILRHEDLSLDPVDGFRQLYQLLDLDFTPHAQQKIINSSSTSNPEELARKSAHATQLDSRASLENWKKRLTAEEVAAIRKLTQDTWPYFYTDEEWR